LTVTQIDAANAAGRSVALPTEYTDPWSDINHIESMDPALIADLLAERQTVELMSNRAQNAGVVIIALAAVSIAAVQAGFNSNVLDIATGGGAQTARGWTVSHTVKAFQPTDTMTATTHPWAAIQTGASVVAKRIALSTNFASTWFFEFLAAPLMKKINLMKGLFTKMEWTKNMPLTVAYAKSLQT